MSFRIAQSHPVIACLSTCAVMFAFGALLPSAWQASMAAEPSDAARAGEWSPVQEWPIIAIHAVLNPNGTLLTFGAEGDSPNATGTGPKRHDTYDPRIGVHATVTQEAQDYFCSATVIVPATSTVLIAGGDDLLKGSRGNALASFYNPKTGQVEPGPGLEAPRWYPTATTLPDGRIVLQGGRFEDDDDPALTPEVFDGEGWTDLPGARSVDAYGRFGEQRRWWYPRAFVDPDGDVFTIAHSTMFTLDTSGVGDIEFHGDLPEGYRGGATSSAVMFAPGRILQAGGGGENNSIGGPALASATIIDISSGKPVVTPAASMHYPRHWANATVLPNGQVLVNGGSAVNNALDGVAYPSELYDPATDSWTVVASEARARLYHSSAVLLADGRVYSGGGGAPGPVANLDAQFYSPPYLFDSAGSLRERPVIERAPPAIAYDDRFELQLAPGSAIARVSLIKTGATTHSFNMDQRFLELTFETNGDRVSVDAPDGPNAATPGYYLLSVIDADGVVSRSSIVSLLNDTVPEDVERLPEKDRSETASGTDDPGPDGQTGGDPGDSTVGMNDSGGSGGCSIAADASGDALLAMFLLIAIASAMRPSIRDRQTAWS